MEGTSHGADGFTELPATSLSDKSPGFSLSWLFKRTSKDPGPKIYDHEKTRKVTFCEKTKDSCDSSAQPLDDVLEWIKVEKDHYSQDSTSASSQSSSFSVFLTRLGPSLSDRHDRNLLNVLKRIKNMLDNKSCTLQQYKDSDLKQYWMPDCVSRECYDCEEKFTTFRRRHHCRVCGQIFCSRCCNRSIPGKIIGYTGELRVCTYCCRVVLSYLQSSNLSADLLADLKLLQEDYFLQSSKNETTNDQDETANTARGANRKKMSVGFHEEKYINEELDGIRAPVQSDQITAERRILVKDSQQLHSLWCQIIKGPCHLSLSSHRHRLKCFNDCFIGRDLVHWLLTNDKASSRSSAVAIGQALLDAGYFTCVSQSEQIFMDEYVIYKPKHSIDDKTFQDLSSIKSQHDTGQEPLWVMQLSSQTKDLEDGGRIAKEESQYSISSSSSSCSFHLDLNVQDIAASVKKTEESDLTDKIASKSSSVADPRSCDSYSTFVLSSLQAAVHRTDFDSRDAESDKMFMELKDSVKLRGQTEPLFCREEDAFLQGVQLRELWDSYETLLLHQLLDYAGLSLTWVDVIQSISHKVASLIKPDVKNDSDDMDIRQYVQFKKIPGGIKGNSYIVSGVVCTKNVLDRSMATKLTDPRILLISTNIDYQRGTSDKLLTIDNVLLQEADYLKNVVAKIVSYKPHIILVQKCISYAARENLQNHGITLVVNVKPSVMERVSRCTQGYLVSSVDAQLTAPTLGMCHNFYVESFELPNGTKKTLMFFDGCAMHLGCTVLLRGADNGELRRVKRIIYFMIFVKYNWNLEKEFLSNIYYGLLSKLEYLDLEKQNVGSDNKDESDQTEPNHHESASKERTNEVEQPLKEPSLEVLESEIVTDFSDPLQTALSFEESLPVATLPVEDNIDNEFNKIFKEYVTLCSPILKINMPYLETKIGSEIPIRHYFPRKIYHSEYLLQQKESTKFKYIEKELPSAKFNNLNFLPSHVFIKLHLTKAANSRAIQAHIADFRARGGRIKKMCFCPPEVHCINRNLKNCSSTQRQSTKAKVEANYSGDFWKSMKMENGKLDALHPFNHQKFSTLFCSFSARDGTHYCVRPWVLTMDFYGTNDIPLGAFLEKYCFSPNYRCPSSACTVAPLSHIRKFVHGSGCIDIHLQQLPSDVQRYSDTIATWNWCLNCREQISYAVLTHGSWSYSFAKFLELRFYGSNIFSTKSLFCTHSLKDHLQFFIKKNVMAFFKYDDVILYEISPPPSSIIFTPAFPAHIEIVETIKATAIQGFSVFSLIHEKLTELKCDCGTKWHSAVTYMSEDHNQRRTQFREQIEHIQLQLTSSYVEDKKKYPNMISEEYDKIMFSILDGIVEVKRIMLQAVIDWNSQVQELMQLKKKEERVDKLRTPSAGHTPQHLPTGGSMALHHQVSSTGEDAESLVCTAACATEGELKVYSDVFEVSSFVSDSEEVLVASQESPVREHKGSLSDEGTIPLVIAKEPIVLEKGVSERKLVQTASTVKTIISNLWSSSANLMIDCPLPASQHFIILTEHKVPVVIYDDEPSSIIAYALASPEYDNRIKEITSLASRPQTSDLDNKCKGAEESSISVSEEKVQQTKDHHIELQWSDQHAKFYCKIFFAEDFLRLRKVVFSYGEDIFVRALSRCYIWDARGGKSGSVFCKTRDDRFILKEMSRFEITSFLEFGPAYVQYILNCQKKNVPTVITKILGVYRIGYKNTTTNKAEKIDFLVLENLFYRRDIKRTYDLKGSDRNRLVSHDGKDFSGVVLLDENLLRNVGECPLYLRYHSKTYLNTAILSDTAFLSQQLIMDYSLLVGIDETKNELIIGIIDYIRTFTWDKKLETIFKGSVLGAGTGKLPTVVSPEVYRKRFCDAMNNYFLVSPDRWSGFVFDDESHDIGQ